MTNIIQELQENKTSFKEVRETFRDEPYFFDIKTSKTYENLYLINVQKDVEKLEKFHDYSCGVIMEKDTNKVVARGFNRNLMATEWDGNHDDIMYVEHAVDGTLIRLYNYEEKWIVSTSRCINSAESFIYENNRNYSELFTETVKDSLDYEKLDKNMTYIFILKHKDSPSVSNYEMSPVVFYVGKVDNNTFTEEFYGDNVDKITIEGGNNNILNLAKTVEFDMNSQNYDNTKGYIVHLKNGRRVEMIFDEFKRIEAIRGGNPNIYLRYFELDAIDAEQLAYYFPKYELYTISKQVYAKCIILHILYKDVYIFRKKAIKDIKDDATREAVHYLIKYSHAIKKRLSLDMVFEKVATYDPHIICNLMGWLRQK
jgi:hypothetical protein